MPQREPEVQVVDDPDNQVPRQVLAQAILDISESMKELIQSGMNERAIIVLVRDSITGRTLGKREIKAVFDALKNLRRHYCQ